MPKIPGVNHLRAIKAFEKAGFKVVRQGKHIVMSDGTHFITIPRHNPVNAITMGGIVKDVGLTITRFKICSNRMEAADCDFRLVNSPGTSFFIRRFNDLTFHLSRHSRGEGGTDHAAIARARARLGTAAHCHRADRPVHQRRRQRPLPGYGVCRSAASVAISRMGAILLDV